MSLSVVQVERGIATKGAEVEVVGLGNTFKTTLTGIGTINTNSVNFGFLMSSQRCSTRNLTELVTPHLAVRVIFISILFQGEAGDNMGCLLRGVKREQVRRGQVIIAPGSMKAVKKFQAQIYVLTKDEGGRYTPFMSNYRPQLFLRTADITVALTFAEGTPDAEEKMVCIIPFSGV
jgi:elongation factor Tu